MFTEILSSGGVSCANMLSEKHVQLPVLFIAANAGNIVAVKRLIEAGANTVYEARGVDLFKLIKDKSMGEHIPELTELIMRQQIAHGDAAVLDPTVTVVTDPGERDASDPRRRKPTSCDVL